MNRHGFGETNVETAPLGIGSGVVAIETHSYGMTDSALSLPASVNYGIDAETFGPCFN